MLLAAVRDRVDERLRRFFEAKKAEATSVSPDSLELVRQVESLTMRGGKRMRAALLVGAMHAVRKDADIALADDVCAGLELLQSYLLIHDDWMDGDDERRGGPSVHAALAKLYGDAHLGASLAILAGDLAATYAFELVVRAPFPPARLREAIDAFVHVQQEVFFGQHLDVVGTRDVSRMHHLKTGSYTGRGPLRLGAILADATPEQCAALEAFGTPIGLAFQLRDDLLGTFGDTLAMGKPTGNDLRAGKRTSLVEEARSALSDRDREPLERVLGDRGASDQAIARATELLVTSGARRRVEERLERCYADAIQALAAPCLHDPWFLRDLGRAMALRDR